MSLTRDKRKSPAEAIVLPALERLGPLPPAEWLHVLKLLRVEILPAGGKLTRIGEIADRFGFVVAGVIKKAHVTADGRTFVRGFGGRASVVGAYVSLLTQQPSELSVEAVCPTELLVLDWSSLEALYARHVCWQVIGRRMAEAFLLEREQRAHELLTLNASERYRLFCASHEALLPFLRGYDIASYLGVTPVSLSRLRARLKKAPNPRPSQ